MCTVLSGTVIHRPAGIRLLRWLYRWVDGDGKPGHIRGVDIFRVRDGKVAEKFSYVKG